MMPICGLRATYLINFQDILYALPHVSIQLRNVSYPVHYIGWYPLHFTRLHIGSVVCSIGNIDGPISSI